MPNVCQSNKQNYSICQNPHFWKTKLFVHDIIPLHLPDRFDNLSVHQWIKYYKDMMLINMKAKAILEIINHEAFRTVYPLNYTVIKLHYYVKDAVLDVLKDHLTDEQYDFIATTLPDDREDYGHAYHLNIVMNMDNTYNLIYEVINMNTGTDEKTHFNVSYDLLRLLLIWLFYSDDELDIADELGTSFFLPLDFLDFYNDFTQHIIVLRQKFLKSIGYNIVYYTTRDVLK